MRRRLTQEEYSSKDTSRSAFRAGIGLARGLYVFVESRIALRRTLLPGSFGRRFADPCSRKCLPSYPCLFGDTFSSYETETSAILAAHYKRISSSTEKQKNNHSNAHDIREVEV